MEKRVSLLSLLFIFLVSLPFASAALWDDIWQKFLSIGNLSFLGIGDSNLVVGFTRLLIGILVFALFFALALKIPYFKRPQAVVVAIVLAIITAIFIPAQALLALGASWAWVIAFILIFTPILGLVYLLLKLPGAKDESRFTLFVKIIICLLLIWIFDAMKYHIGRMGI